MRAPEVEILIELKSLTAPLTDKQPTGYLDYLSRSRARERVLVFIIPSRYELRKELERRVERTSTIADSAHVRVLLAHWEQLIRIIDERGLSRSGSLFRHLNLLLEELFQRPPIVFTSAELTLMQRPEIAKIVIELFRLVQAAEDGLREREHFKVAPYRKDDARGFYVSIGGEAQIWIGVWWSLWKKCGWPLSIGVSSRSNNKITERFERRYSSTRHEDHLVAEFGASLNLRSDPITIDEVGLTESLFKEVEYLLGSDGANEAS